MTVGVWQVGMGYYLILLAIPWAEECPWGSDRWKGSLAGAGGWSFREWEKAERPRLGRCTPMLRAEGVAPSAGDGWNQCGPQSWPLPSPGVELNQPQGLGAGGKHSLRQELWEKDSSSRSHSSCRLPLPRQVQLKATLALILLTKLGVKAVPIEWREDYWWLSQLCLQLPSISHLSQDHSIWVQSWEHFHPPGWPTCWLPTHVPQPHQSAPCMPADIWTALLHRSLECPWDGSGSENLPDVIWKKGNFKSPCWRSGLQPSTCCPFSWHAYLHAKYSSAFQSLSHGLLLSEACSCHSQIYYHPSLHSISLLTWAPKSLILRPQAVSLTSVSLTVNRDKNSTTLWIFVRMK